MCKNSFLQAKALRIQETRKSKEMCVKLQKGKTQCGITNGKRARGGLRRQPSLCATKRGGGMKGKLEKGEGSGGSRASVLQRGEEVEREAGGVAPPAVSSPKADASALSLSVCLGWGLGRRPSASVITAFWTICFQLGQSKVLARLWISRAATPSLTLRHA